MTSLKVATLGNEDLFPNLSLNLFYLTKHSILFNCFKINDYISIGNIFHRKLSVVGFLTGIDPRSTSHYACAYTTGLRLYTLDK